MSPQSFQADTPAERKRRIHDLIVRIAVGMFRAVGGRPICHRRICQRPTVIPPDRCPNDRICTFNYPNGGSCSVPFDLGLWLPIHGAKQRRLELVQGTNQIVP